MLSEKPLALSAAEVDQMAALSAQTGLPVVEASWYRWHPRVRLAQQHLAGIGPVRHVAAGFTFAADLTGNYRSEPARGGGALYDVGCYAVSACLWAIGQGAPSEVTARSSYAGSGIDLDTTAMLDWPSGATAEVRAAMDRDLGQWLVITGDKGEIELRGEPFTAWKQASELWVSDGVDTQRLPVPATDAYRLMIEEVSAVLEGGPGWTLPLAESRQTAAVLDAALASAAAGGAPHRVS